MQRNNMDLSYFVTNFDILSVFKDAKIRKYADLDKYADIYQLMPQRIDYVIILTESDTNT